MLADASSSAVDVFCDDISLGGNNCLILDCTRANFCSGSFSICLQLCLGPSAVTIMLVRIVSRGRWKGSMEGPFLNSLLSFSDVPVGCSTYHGFLLHRCSFLRLVSSPRRRQMLHSWGQSISQEAAFKFYRLPFQRMFHFLIYSVH